MPEVKPNESEKDYVSRCVPYVIKEEGLTQDQALGKCYGMYKKKTESVFNKRNALLESEEPVPLEESSKVRLDIEGPNQTVVTIGDYDFYFSYKTCVAVRIASDLYCSTSEWSSTTAKYLNKIQPDKTQRIDAVEFDKLIHSIKVTSIKP